MFSFGVIVSIVIIVQVSTGIRCALVTDVINILVEYGEINPDAEVNVSVILCVVLVVFHFRVTKKPLWNFV